MKHLVENMEDVRREGRSVGEGGEGGVCREGGEGVSVGEGEDVSIVEGGVSIGEDVSIREGMSA